MTDKTVNRGDRKKSRKLPGKRRLRRAALITACSLVLLGAAGTLIIHSRSFQAWLLQQLVQRLREQAGMTLSADRFHLRPFALAVELEDVRVQALPGIPGPVRAVTAERIEVDLGISTLLGSKVHLQALRLLRPRIELSSPADPASAAAEREAAAVRRPARPSSDSMPVEWRIDRFQLESGEIGFGDESRGLTADLAGITAELSFLKKEDRHVGKIHSGPGELRIADRNIPLRSLRAELEAGTDWVDLQSLVIESDPLNMSLRGRIRAFQSAPEFDLEAEGRVHLPSLQNQIGGDLPFSGGLSFSGRMFGPADDPRAEISLAGKSLAGKSLVLAGVPMEEVRADLAGSGGGIELRSLSLRGEAGRIFAQGGMEAGAAGAVSANLTWEDLDLARLSFLLGGQSIGITAFSEGRLSARMQGLDPATLNAEGRAVFLPMERPAAAAHPLSLTGNLNLKAEKGRFSLDTRDLKLENHLLSLSTDFDREGIQRARFFLLSDELSRLPGQVEALLNPPRGLPPAVMQMAGRLAITGEARGKWGAPRIQIGLKGQNLRLGKIGEIPLEGELSIDGAGLELHRLELSPPGGSFSMRGRVDYDPKRAPQDQTIRATAEARNIDLASLADWLLPEMGIRGRFSGTLKGRGSLSRPEATFQLGIREGFLAGEGLDSLDVEGGLTGDRLDCHRMEAVKGASRLNGNFSLGLRSLDYRVRLSVDPIDLTTINSLQSQGFSAQGQLRIFLEGEGNRTHPRFHLEADGRDLHINQARWSSLSFEADSDGKTARARFSLPGRKAELTARLPLSGPPSIEGRLATEGLDILAWLPAPAARSPESSLTSTLDFAIPLKDWKKSEITWTITEASLQRDDLALRTTGPTFLEWKNRALLMRDVGIEGPSFQLQVSGRIPLEGPDSGGIRVRGSADLSRLGFLLPGLRPAGTLRIDGGAGGSLTRPIFDARIELKNGGLEAPPSPLSVTDAGMRAVLIEDRIEIEDLSFKTAGGRISAVGSIPLAALLNPGRAEGSSDFPGTELTVRLDQLDPAVWLPLPDPQAEHRLRTRISGAFHIGGRIDRIDGVVVEGALSELAVYSAGLSLVNPKDVSIHMRDGRLRIDAFELAGGGSEVTLRAEMAFSPSPRFEAELNARVEAALFNPLLKDLTVGGRMNLELKGHGSPEAPIITGRGTVTRGYMEFSEFPLAITEITGTLEILPDSISANGWTGVGNGGPLQMNGSLAHEFFQIRSAKADLQAENVQIDMPEGIQGVAAGRFELSGSPPEWLISGNIRLNQGYFGRTIHPGGELFGLIGRPALTRAPPPPPIRDIRLNIQLETGDDLVVDNNLAELELAGNLRLTGTIGRPLLTGRIANRNAGSVTFGGRSFEVETAAVDYTGQPPAEGRLDLSAHTQMKHQYDELTITLSLSGPLTRLEYGLSSDPPRAQGELASLLITGYGTEKLRSDTANVIGSQMILYFTSPLASPITERIRRLLGAEEVSLEPINIASEEDPGARFTFRKGLIRNLDLVYSIDIGNTQEQAWLLEYNLSRRFSLSTFRRDNGSYGASLGSRFSLGGPHRSPEGKPAAASRQTRVGRVEFLGSSPLADSVLRSTARTLRSGRPFLYSELRKTLDRLETRHKRGGYLDTVINSRVERRDARTTDIFFEIEPGPPASLLLTGLGRGGKLEKELIQGWNGRIPAEMSLADAGERIRSRLIGRGYYEADVASRVTQDKKAGTIYRFEVRRGPKYRIRGLRLPPESPVTVREVRRALQRIIVPEGRGVWTLLTRFSQARTQILELLAGKGYRSPVLSKPVVEVDKAAAALDLFLPLAAGPLSRVSAVMFEGSAPVSEADLRGGLILPPGSVFSPDRMMDDRNRMERLYRSLGYQDVRLTPEVQTLPGTSDLNLFWRIEPGERHFISEIRISGNRRTPARLIQREMLFGEGDPLDLEKLMLSQKRLYELRVFRSVNIRWDRSGPQGTGAVILVEVEEAPPLTLGLGLRYNSEEKLGGYGQVDITNPFSREGKGLIFYKQNQRQKDLRLSFSTPYLLGRRIETLQSFSYLEEVESIFKSEELGYSIQQRIKLPLRLSLSYLFRLSRIHTYELESLGPFPFDITLFLSELQTFLVRDTRDDKLNARRGSFLSLSLTYSPDFLGSDLTFVRLFAQSSFFINLGRGVVWASNTRVGLADAFDQVLIPSRRFFAGGGNSLRGFERDMLGPYNTFFQEADGGEGLLLINQELRFPIWRWLGGVLFFDCGNIYAELKDFDPLELRYSLGGGIRLDTPIALFRLDYGLNLDPRPWERTRGILFFSLGHSF